ncbi:tetratricopeptide repeat protein [bacterium]|nr:tetratricopeptide repeat protein [bacterium]
MNKSHNITNFSILALLLSFAVGCSSMGNGGYVNSALSNQNPAPEKFNPSHVLKNKTIDPFYMRTQADYHFTLGESFSLEGNVERAIEEFKLTLVFDADSQEVRLRLSAEYVKLGLLSEALEQAEMVVQAKPDYTDARLLLAGIYTTLKMFDLAQAQYEVIVKQDPTNTMAHLYIGAIYAEQQMQDKAIAYFYKITKNKSLKEKWHIYYYYAGKAQLEKGKEFYSQAIDAFSRSLSVKPEFLDSTLALALIYERQNKTNKSINLLSSYQKRFGPKKEVANYLSKKYLEKENYEKAYEQLEIIEGFDGENVNAKLRMAMILIELKKYPQAIYRLEELLVQQPESDKIIFYLGAVYEEIKDSASARKYFSKVKPESIFYPEAIIHQAYLLKADKGGVDEAIAVVEKGIKMRPEIPQFYAFYASTLDEKQEYGKAVVMLENSIKKFPENLQLRFYLGSMYDRIKQPKKTIEQMKFVLSREPNHVQALNFLAYTYAEQGQELDAAFEMASKALELSPEDGYILDTMGWVLFKMGRYEESIKHLEAAYKTKVDESVIAEHLGDVYFKFQLSDKAKIMYFNALKAEKDASKIVQIKQKINAIDQQNIKLRVPASVQNDK